MKCADCLHLDEHVVGAGVRYCQGGFGWQWPDGRQFRENGGLWSPCHKFVDRDSLAGLLAENERARKRLRRALELHTGANVGTVDDPRHPSLPPERKGRKKK